MINNLNDIIKLVNNYYEYLIKRGFKFNSEGFPIFERDMFVEEYPEMVVPFYRRKSVTNINSKEIVLCFFCKDADIYPRLERILEDIDEYKKYKGIIISDLSVTKDMDFEYQNLIMLINQLFGAILAINGIKIIINTRSGDIKTLINFKSIPQKIMCASSFFGCELQKETDIAFIYKIMLLRPSKLIIYGKRDKNAERLLNNMGIQYRYYPDFYSFSKANKRIRRCA